MRPIPVLMYHHVTPHKGDLVTVTPEIFAGQMQYLAEAGYRTLTLAELLDHIRGVRPVSEKSVVVTFDDGWLDNFHFAYPVLQQYGIKAAVFIVTNRTEAASVTGSTVPAEFPRHGEAKRLAEQGSANLVVMDWQTIRVMERELEQPCPYLCWPYGSFDERGVAMAAQAGYEALFTTIHGVAGAGDDPMRIKRIVVKGDVDWFKWRMRIYTNSLLAACYLGLKS
jgi:peptidoglycan/xylan/chitin deacetylase (PgdA/CDA1 family)